MAFWPAGVIISRRDVSGAAAAPNGKRYHIHTMGCARPPAAPSGMLPQPSPDIAVMDASVAPQPILRGWMPSVADAMQSGDCAAPCARTARPACGPGLGPHAEDDQRVYDFGPFVLARYPLNLRNRICRPMLTDDCAGVRCQMNLADSERMAGVLEAAGYRCADDAGDAHVLVYNTCSIRDKAEQKVYSALGKQVQAIRPRGDTEGTTG